MTNILGPRKIWLVFSQEKREETNEKLEDHPGIHISFTGIAGYSAGGDGAGPGYDGIG
jgi:hypothetical protein